MKRAYYKRFKYDEPWCPPCGVEMEERDVGCGDDDEQCECDRLLVCPKCGWTLSVPCAGMHRGTFEADDEIESAQEDRLPFRDKEAPV